MRTTATNLRWPVQATPAITAARCRAKQCAPWPGRSRKRKKDSTLVLLGQLDFGPQGPTNVRLEHRFTLSSTGRVVEQLSLLHHRGRDHLDLSGARFGFRKTLRSRFAPGVLQGLTSASWSPSPCAASPARPQTTISPVTAQPTSTPRSGPSGVACRQAQRRGLAVVRARGRVPGGEVQPGAHRVQCG